MDPIYFVVGLAKTVVSTITPMQSDITLDTFGLMCPIPIIKTAAQIKDMTTGEILEVQADDDQILEDMPAWCKSNGHELLDIIEEDGEFTLYVKKMY